MNEIQIKNELEVIKNFVAGNDFKGKSYKLDEATNIKDVHDFFISHIDYIENNLHNSTYKPFLIRIILMYEILKN